MGFAEMLIVLIIAILFYLIPSAVFVWILITLNGLRKGQEEIRNKLEMIKQSLKKEE